MTSQEIFNKVWAHAQAMTEPAWWEERVEQCLYLTPTGNKCFIGVLIPDGHEAQKSLQSVSKIVLTWPDLPFADWVNEDPERATELQYCHDMCADPGVKDDFSNRFTKLREWAAKYGVTVPGETV